MFTQIVLRAALPELLAGLRLGIIRGLKGVIIGQLLIAVVGVAFTASEVVATMKERCPSMLPAADTNQQERYAVRPEPPTLLPVAGSDQVFPVGRIFCIGRNYAEHAVEMGHDPDREPPFFFSKPPNAVVPDGSELDFPVGTSDLHHEIELVVALGSGGRDVPVDRALDLVHSYAVGLDMTRRDIQAVAKKAGRPWDMAKGFDESAPCSALRPAAEIGHPAAGAIWLDINGERRQQGDLAQQIWSVPEALAYLSTLVALRPGDLLMTGTPAGVGSVQPGDRLSGHIDGIGDLTVGYRPA